MNGLILDNDNLDKQVSIKDIATILNNFSIDGLSDKNKNIIINELLKNKAVKELEKKVLVESTDLNKLINDFLNTFKSLPTKKSYANAIKKFLDYCNTKNIQPLLIDSQQVDLFSAYLYNNLSNNTATLTIASVSSFYKTLIKWNILEKTPFIKVKRYKKALKDKKIPTQKEINFILKEIKELKFSKDFYYSILLTTQLGIRVGLLDNIKFTEKLGAFYFSGISKGKEYRGAIPSELNNTIREIIKNDIKFNSNSLQTRLNKLNKLLKDKSTLENVYSYHDFRHYYAITQYSNDKDIYKLSKALNHSNIAITTTYLQGLNTKI